MSHSKSLFILIGTTILSLILIAGIIDYTALAQEEKDEEKEEEEDKEDSKEEESEESSKEEEEKEESEESSNEGEEQQKEESTSETVPNTTTTVIPEIIPVPQPTATEAEPIITTVQPQPPQQKEEFNATCKCMTTSLAEKPITTTTPPQQPSSNNQIPVTSANIVDSKSLGQVIDANYTGFYTVSNLLDNKIDDVSFWSQAGKSSFYIKLDNILDQYQVCSAELSVHKPTNAPFLLDIGVTKDYTGVIDQTTEKIQFDKCVKNMDEILVSIDNPANTYISIAELKLFGSKLGAATITPLSPQQTATIPQPTLEPKTEEANKINIQDSKAEISIKNSTVTFKFDPMTATFVQQGVQ